MPTECALSNRSLHAAGLGKTTIAHVVARHCGYRPFEINASDDRTATALQSRIQDAVQMQSVLGKRQMNLVIVDEVDGIAGHSSRLFLALAFSAQPLLFHQPACAQAFPDAPFDNLLINAIWCYVGIFHHCVGCLCFGFPCCFEADCLVVMKFVWVCRGE